MKPNVAYTGLDKGITPLELAAAYATIANDGNYIEPTFYTRVENRLAKTVVKSSQSKSRAFSKEDIIFNDIVIIKTILDEVFL